MRVQISVIFSGEGCGYRTERPFTEVVYKFFVINVHDLKCFFSYIVTIQFTEFPQKPKVVLSGEKVTLRCVVRAFPDPQTAWKKDGELVTKDDNHMITSSELIIKKAVRSDMGNYSCIAWNRGSVQAKSTLVLITGKDITP